MLHDSNGQPDEAARPKITLAQAREKMIQLLTDQWLTNLTALAEKLKTQGFSDEEAVELCLGYKPLFEENLTNAILQFDVEAAKFAAKCRASEAATNG